MDFLKRHVFLIGCVLGVAAGSALGVLGFRATPRVMEELRKAETLYRTLNGLQSTPVNQKSIDLEQERIDLVTSDRERVFEHAKRLYGYEPLMEGVFPDGAPLKRTDFRSRYTEEMGNLLDSLNYGGPATGADIAIVRDLMESEKAERREFGLDADADRAAPAYPTGPPQTPAGVLTKAGAMGDAVARAHMAAAQRIYCYGIHWSSARPPMRESALDFDPAMRDEGQVDAPMIDEVWRSQIGYWIQKDVVEAIASINNAAAAEARTKGQDVWVGIMPVKEVISIRLTPDPLYVPAEGELFALGQPGGYDASIPPGTAESVFTGSRSGPRYEVVQFSVKLVMDQRDIPSFVDRLTKDSFHTLVRVVYEVVPPNRDMVGKIYGSEPTVNVVLDFESIMLGDVFRPLMPEETCELNEINCPPRGDAEEEG